MLGYRRDSRSGCHSTPPLSGPLHLLDKEKRKSFNSSFCLFVWSGLRGHGLGARRASVTGGSDSHLGCHSTPPLSSPSSPFRRKEKGRASTLPFNLVWSGLRGSNPPPQPWQGCALPNELNPHVFFVCYDSIAHSFIFVNSFLKKIAEN